MAVLASGGRQPPEGEPAPASGGRQPPEGITLGGLTPPARLVAWTLLAVTAFVLFAHGCHGPDEDHEPSAVPISHDSRD
jgi:hypothetical protein